METEKGVGQPSEGRDVGRTVAKGIVGATIVLILGALAAVVLLFSFLAGRGDSADLEEVRTAIEDVPETVTTIVLETTTTTVGFDAEIDFSDESSVDEFRNRGGGNYDHDAIDFGFMGEPTFSADIADLGGDRIREIEFFLPPGTGGVSFAISNPEPVRIDGQGIAVRTNQFARILRSSGAFETPRPTDCVDGNCRLFVWLTMGPQFLDEHPDAELLIWAGEGAAVTIEAMPMENIRDETFRQGN